MNINNITNTHGVVIHVNTNEARHAQQQLVAY